MATSSTNSATTATTTTTMMTMRAPSAGGLERLPQEVISFHVLLYLSQSEVVLGLSATCSYLRTLTRGEYEVTVDLLPYEKLKMPIGWTHMVGVRCRPTVWGKKGVRFGELVSGIKKDGEGCFTFERFKNRLEKFPSQHYCSFAQFELQKLQTLKLKSLEIQWVNIYTSDLMIIRNIKTLESLTFDNCDFKCVIDVFPPKLRRLQVTNPPQCSGRVEIKNLPDSLESAEIHKLLVGPNAEPRSLFPPGFQDLKATLVLESIDHEEEEEEEDEDEEEDYDEDEYYDDDEDLYDDYDEDEDDEDDEDGFDLRHKKAKERVVRVSEKKAGHGVKKAGHGEAKKAEHDGVKKHIQDEEKKTEHDEVKKAECNDEEKKIEHDEAKKAEHEEHEEIKKTEVKKVEEDKAKKAEEVKKGKSEIKDKDEDEDEDNDGEELHLEQLVEIENELRRLLALCDADDDEDENDEEDEEEQEEEEEGGEGKGNEDKDDTDGFVTNLPFSFPSGFKTLNISRMCRVQDLTPLSGLNQLETLEFHDCCCLRSIPFLSGSLRRLVLEGCGRLEAVLVSPSLEELECLTCGKLDLDISSLPQHMKKLRIVSCGKIGEKTTFSLPSNLTALHLEGFDKVEALPDLPRRLKSLILSQFDRLKSLPKFPESLRNLILEDLKNLSQMQGLPKDLEQLSFLGQGKMKLITQFPPSLKALTIWGWQMPNYKFPSLPNTLLELVVSDSSENFELSRFPSRLEHLHFKDISGMDTLPPFPETLKTLNLDTLENLEGLPSLPESLLDLTLQRCNSIHGLPSLPSKLRLMSVLWCEDIEFIKSKKGSSNQGSGIGLDGKLPEFLKALILINCPKIRAVGKLPSNLQLLSLQMMDKDLQFRYPIPERLENVLLD